MNSIGGTAERDLNANLKFNYNEANNTPAVHSYLAVIKLSAHAKCKIKTSPLIHTHTCQTNPF